MSTPNHSPATPRTSGRSRATSRSCSTGRTLMAFALAVLMSLFAASCGSDAVDQATDEIDDAAETAGEVLADTDVPVDTRSAEVADALRSAGASSIATLVETVDFDDLTNSAEFTFFAPNDDAFLDLTADQTADLLANPEDALRVLQNHVAVEQIDSETLVTMDSIETEAGETLPVSVDGDTVMVGAATVTQADLAGAGGLIHVVDTFLMP